MCFKRANLTASRNWKERSPWRRIPREKNSSGEMAVPIQSNIKDTTPFFPPVE